MNFNLNTHYDELKKTWDLFSLTTRQIAFIGKVKTENHCLMCQDFDTFWQVYNTNNNANKKIYFRLNTPTDLDYAKWTHSWQKDENISQWEFLFIELDYKDAEIGASDEQVTETYNVATQIINLLLSEGFGNPYCFGFSGNGYHLIYRFEASQGNGEVEKFLKSLKSNFSSFVDTSVANLSRLTRFYGTINNKSGRQSQILQITENQVPINATHIENFLAKYPAPEETNEYIATASATPSTFTTSASGWWTEKDDEFRDKFFSIFETMENFLMTYDLYNYREEYIRDGVKHGDMYVLKRCPFQTHKIPGERDSIVFDNYLQKRHTLSYKCIHDTCGKDAQGNDLPGLKKFSYFVHQVIGEEEFNLLFSEQQPQEEENTNFIFNLTKRRKQPQEFYSTGYKNLDTNLEGGLVQRGLSVITGKECSGKTTFINNIIWNVTASNLKTVYYTEQDSDDVCTCLAKTYYQNATITETQREVALSEIEGKLAIYNRENNFNNWRQVLSDVNSLLEQRNDFKILVLDNLSVLCAYNSENLSEQQELAIELVKIAQEKNIHVCLVAHPSKQGEKVAGTSQFQNLASQVFEIENISTKQQKLTKLNILKNRQNGNHTSCYFSYNNCRLTEIK